MPSLIPLNIFNNYLVEEFNIYDVDDKIIENAFKDAFFFINPLEFLLKK